MAALPRWLPHRLIGPDQEKVGMAVLHSCYRGSSN